MRKRGGKIRTIILPLPVIYQIGFGRTSSKPVWLNFPIYPDRLIPICPNIHCSVFPTIFPNMSKKIFLTFFLDSIQLSHGFSHVRCSRKSIPPDGITISRAVLSLLPVVEPAIDHLKNWQGWKLASNKELL